MSKAEHLRQLAHDAATLRAQAWGLAANSSVRPVLLRAADHVDQLAAEINGEGLVLIVDYYCGAQDQSWAGSPGDWAAHVEEHDGAYWNVNQWDLIRGEILASEGGHPDMTPADVAKGWRA